MDLFSNIIILAVIYLGILSVSSIGSIISERAGIINIGINGTIVFGATIYMIFASVFSNKGLEEASPWLQIPLFLISGLGGMIFSTLHGFATIKLKANQIISGVAMNILAPAITLVVLFVFGEANMMQYWAPELSLGNSSNGELTSIISLSTIVFVLIIVISIIMLNKTKWGLRLKSVGENPQAADAVGINVNSLKWQAILISGLLAGIAGAMFMSCGRFGDGGSFKGSVQGLGFLSLAIMIVGKWKILPSLLAAILFTILLSISYSNIFPSKYESYKYLLLAVPYVMTVVAMAVFGKKSIGPKAAGVPYDKTLR